MLSIRVVVMLMSNANAWHSIATSNSGYEAPATTRLRPFSYRFSIHLINIFMFVLYIKNQNVLIISAPNLGRKKKRGRRRERGGGKEGHDAVVATKARDEGPARVLATPDRRFLGKITVAADLI